MNQIAIGDSSSWTILDGASIAAPFRKASVFFSHAAPSAEVKEKIEIQLAGTPAQITSAQAGLDLIMLRSKAYARGEYNKPQMLRFQMASGGSYYYAQISNLSLQPYATSYLHHQKGSYLFTLHYTRLNHFDGDQVELPLTGKDASDVTGGYNLINCRDHVQSLGNFVMVKAADVSTDLPAPLRIELKNTYATNKVHDLYFGLFHHPTGTSEEIFYAYATDMSGGTQYYNANAINTYYRRVNWTASSYTALFNYSMPASEVNSLDGRSFRPVLHLYNSHTYPDLYLKIKLLRGSYILHTCDAVYADPDYDYVIFPPIQIPPNRLLRETLPHHVEIQIYGLKEDGTAAQIDVDCLQFLPLDYAASFFGFFDMSQNDKLLDDSFRGLSNVAYSAAAYETISHIRAGSPLLLYPGRNSFLFFILANQNNTVDILRTSTVQVFYRSRVLFL